jgi:hypothetical protein
MSKLLKLIHGTYWYILARVSWHTGTYRYRRKPNGTRSLEEELGACIPTVFKGNIVYIFCYAEGYGRITTMLSCTHPSPSALE